ncbi:MAG: patatin-like phospholipase family protein [Usitatibacter sp.]
MAARRSRARRVNLALQGGGSHGAYAWGVLDALLADGRLEVDGISGTSAGSVNAVVYAYGRMMGGADGARELLHKFWKRLADSGAGFSYPEAFQAFKAMTGSISPYQWNPFNWNPFRQALVDTVDFEQLRTCKSTKLFLGATNVETGKARVFTTPEVSADVVMASSCLPFLFQAVEIEGQHYWDGGYMGNPALYPLFYETSTRDVIIVHVNPIERKGVPRLAHEIENRLNEITFNSSLIKELRAVAFVQKLIEEGWLKDEFAAKLRHVLMHSVRADKVLADLSVPSKFSLEWKFLRELHERGISTGREWLAANYRHIGKRSSLDVRKEFL